MATVVLYCGIYVSLHLGQRSVLFNGLTVCYPSSPTETLSGGAS